MIKLKTSDGFRLMPFSYQMGKGGTVLKYHSSLLFYADFKNALVHISCPS